MTNDNINFEFNENTIFIEDWFLFDPDDWGASMGAFRCGKTLKEINEKNIHVSGSPACELTVTYKVTNDGLDEFGCPVHPITIPEKLWREKISV